MGYVLAIASPSSIFTGLTFGSPVWLWGLLALPMLAALFVWAEARAIRRLAAFIRDPRLRTQLTGAASAGRRRLRFALLLLGLAGLIGAMAQPRRGFEERQTHRRGLDLVVIVDVSKSMLATDLTPNRLTRAKLAVQDLVGQLQGDRLGLVAFAGSAFLQAPLTIDYDAVISATHDLDVDLIPLGGTNIGGAIDLALDAFGKADAGNRAILLFSDGEPTSDGEQANGLEAAIRAATAGVKIFTVGFGTPEGSLIPVAGGRHGEFVRDEDGKVVRTRLDEANLREIAKAGNGFYLRFTNGEANMRTVIQDGLSQLKVGEINSHVDRRPIERYQWPLGAGLLFLFLGSLPGERRTRAPASARPSPAPGTAVRGRPPAKIAVAAAALIAAFACSCGVQDLLAEEKAGAPAAGDLSPLSLYESGKYDEAYRKFEELAKNNPDMGSLQFNAGASAYMGKQYDEALDAFGKALTSPDMSLRAKSDYNFGNTLFRRGAEQKDRDKKLADWKNAIQHYNSTLDAIKKAPQPATDSLATNTAYNRDLVQHQIDEELKQPPPPPKQDKKKSDDKSDQKKQQSKQDPSKQDSSKQDQKSGDQQQQQQGGGQQGQQSQQPPGDSQNQSGSSPSDKNSEGNKPPQPDKQGQSDQKQSAQPSPGGGSPNPSNDEGNGKGDQSKPDQGKPGDSGNSGNSGNSGEPGSNDAKSPDGSGANKPRGAENVPNQDKPRQRGDFQARPDGEGKEPQASPGQESGEATEGTEEAGKMSAGQARALLDSLRGEDAHVTLKDPSSKHGNDEVPAKDW